MAKSNNRFSIKRHILILLLSLFVSILILSFKGQFLEDSIRNFYRNDICNCDTLRPNEFVDSLGVPVVDFYSIAGFHIGKQRNPVSVCFKADEYFQNQEYVKFDNCVKWIIDNSQLEDSARFLNYNYDWLYGMKKPWKSAMAQGLAIKTLTQAYENSKDSNYLAAITELLNSFYVPVDSGGIAYLLSDTAFWYEEYSHINSQKPMILNGMMFSLDGLYYNYEKTGNKKSLDLFSKGINALEIKLKNYDNGSLSYYDNQKNISTEYYHNIHVTLLMKFYEITGSNIFKEYYEKWELYKPDNYLIAKIKSPNKAFIILLFGFIIMFYLIFALIRIR